MNTLRARLAAAATQPGHRERGSVSVWMATATMVIVLMVGLAVDLAGQVHAMQQARSVAAQAARAGGQQLVASESIRGHQPRADAQAAAAAAYQYLAVAGVPGEVSIQAGDTVVVSVTGVYDTKFLGIIGVGQLSVTGTSQSRMVRVREGIEQ